MKISVIVPVWNAEKYLERCVRSVQAQTHTDWELILVDDGSTDASGALCDAFAAEDARIRAIHQPNGGVSAARNAGLDAVTGDWISFCDSDDMMYPRQLEFLLDLCHDRHVTMAVCGFDEVDIDAPLPAAAPLRGDATELIDPWQYIERLCTHLQVLYVVPWGKLYARSVFKGVRYPEGVPNEDDCVIHHLALNAKQIAVNYEPLYGYRINPSSLSHKGTPEPWILAMPYKRERMNILRNNKKFPLLYRVQRLLFYDLLLQHLQQAHCSTLHRYAVGLWFQMLRNPAASRKELLLTMPLCLVKPNRLAGHSHAEFLS